MQYSPGAHGAWPERPQEVCPGSHWPPASEQDAIGSGRPAHTSQAPHVLKHPVTGVQGLQAEGSASVSSRQLPAPSRVEPMKTWMPLPAGNSQQPKQSQPFGVSGPQVSTHASS